MHQNKDSIQSLYSLAKFSYSVYNNYDKFKDFGNKVYNDWTNYDVILKPLISDITLLMSRIEADETYINNETKISCELGEILANVIWRKLEYELKYELMLQIDLWMKDLVDPIIEKYIVSPAADVSSTYFIVPMIERTFYPIIAEYGVGMMYYYGSNIVCTIFFKIADNATANKTKIARKVANLLSTVFSTQKISPDYICAQCLSGLIKKIDSKKNVQLLIENRILKRYMTPFVSYACIQAINKVVMTTWRFYSYYILIPHLVNNYVTLDVMEPTRTIKAKILDAGCNASVYLNLGSWFMYIMNQTFNKTCAEINGNLDINSKYTRKHAYYTQKSYFFGLLKDNPVKSIEIEYTIEFDMIRQIWVTSKSKDEIEHDKMIGDTENEFEEKRKEIILWLIVSIFGCTLIVLITIWYIFTRIWYTIINSQFMHNRRINQMRQARLNRFGQ